MTYGVLKANYLADNVKEQPSFEKRYKFFAIIYENRAGSSGFDFMERPLKKYIRKHKKDPATGLPHVKNPDNWNDWLMVNLRSKEAMTFKSNAEQWGLFERKKVIEIISNNYDRYEVWVKK